MGNNSSTYFDEKLNNEEIILNDEWDEIVSDEETDEECYADEENAVEYYDTNSMKMYLSDIGKIPLLSAEEEIELGKKIKEGGPEAAAAREKLINSNLRLVVHYAKQFHKEGVDLEDINSMGVEGLIKAAEKYDYSLGYRFSTYASNWIRQSIMRRLSEETGPVRLPSYVSENLMKIMRAQKQLEAKLMREPSVEEIAVATGLDEKTVIKTIEAKYKMISLDIKVGEDGETTHLDTIADDNVRDLSEDTIKRELREAIDKVLGQLSVREALILKLRYGIDSEGEMTLEDIAKLPDFKVSRERVRQIEARAFMKIRHNPKMISLLREYRTA